MHHRTRRFVVAGTSAAALALWGFAAPIGAQESGAAFSFTGEIQSFTVPAEVCAIRVELAGASGAGSSEGSGGVGGSLGATFDVAPGQVLTVVVGGAADGWTGGWGGLAPGGDSGTHFSDSNVGSAGGAGTYVALGDEVLAAAGGGGGGGQAVGDGGDGAIGPGAGANGSTNADPTAGGIGEGGSLDGPGAGGASGGPGSTAGADGALHAGGNGGDATADNAGSGGGGGGGWFGGGGGGGATGNETGGGGGGGASGAVDRAREVTAGALDSDEDGNGRATVTVEGGCDSPSTTTTAPTPSTTSPTSTSTTVRPPATGPVVTPRFAG